MRASRTEPSGDHKMGRHGSANVAAQASRLGGGRRTFRIRAFSLRATSASKLEETCMNRTAATRGAASARPHATVAPTRREDR